MDYKVDSTNYIPAWVEALRSGKYPKGKGYLHGKDGYCCLGVLCEVAGVHETLTPGHDSGMYENMNTVLPHELAKHLNIHTTGDFYNGVAVPGESVHDDDDDDPYRYGGLTEINDDTELGFNAIADIIEAEHAKGNLKPYTTY